MFERDGLTLVGRSKAQEPRKVPASSEVARSLRRAEEVVVCVAEEVPDASRALQPGHVRIFGRAPTISARKPAFGVSLVGIERETRREPGSRAESAERSTKNRTRTA